MPDSMYEEPESEADSATETPESEEKESGEETALLPKTLFGEKELEVGGKCEVEIVHIYGDEVEVKYVPHKKDEKPDKEMSMKDKIANAAT